MMYVSIESDPFDMTLLILKKLATNDKYYVFILTDQFYFLFN